MIGYFMNGKALVLMSLIDLDHMAAVRTVFKILFQDRNQILLFVVSDDDIYRQIRFQLLCSRLDITACRNYNRLRILFFCPMQHLSGLTVRDIGH